MSTRIGGITEDEEIGHDLKNIHDNVITKKKRDNIKSNDGHPMEKNNDELSTIMSRSQCSTCVSYVCKVCGENVHRGSGQTSTAGAETCYSCSIYEGNQSVLGSDISSCNSQCSSKAPEEISRWKRSLAKNRGNYSSSEDGGSMRSRRSVQIIRTDSESSLTDSGSEEESLLGALDSPQTGNLMCCIVHI